MAERDPRRLAPEDRRRVGQAAEAIAVAHLTQQPTWRVLATNVYFRAGELDVVALEGEVLVFVEVRGRWSESGPRAEDSVTRTKQQRLTRAAMLWLQRHPEHRRRRARFDVIALDLRRGRVLAHHRAAFYAQA